MPFAAFPHPRLNARRIAGLALALLAALVVVIGIVAPDAPAAGSEAPTATAATAVATPRTTLEEIQKELMCSTCRVPLEQSDSPQAQQERQTIERLIAEGKTKDEVIDAMVEIYSESVLIHPPEEGVRTLRWLVPTLVALLGFGLVVLLVARWRRATRGERTAATDEAVLATNADDAAVTDDALSPADQARLDADLDRYA